MCNVVLLFCFMEVLFTCLVKMPEMCRGSAELLTLCVDSEEGGPVCKPCLDLLHPGQVCHEGRSGAGAKVDDKRLPRPSYTEQGHLVPSDRVVQHRVRGRAVQGGYLQG